MGNERSLRLFGALIGGRIGAAERKKDPSYARATLLYDDDRRGGRSGSPLRRDGEEPKYSWESNMAKLPSDSFSVGNPPNWIATGKGGVL